MKLLSETNQSLHSKSRIWPRDRHQHALAATLYVAHQSDAGNTYPLCGLEQDHGWRSILFFVFLKKERRHEGGPSGLVTGPNPLARVAIEIFAEWNVIPPVRIALKILIVA